MVIPRGALFSMRSLYSRERQEDKRRGAASNHWELKGDLRGLQSGAAGDMVSAKAIAD